jgi:hypothetical protein
MWQRRWVAPFVASCEAEAVKCSFLRVVCSGKQRVCVLRARIAGLSCYQLVADDISWALQVMHTTAGRVLEEEVADIYLMGDNCVYSICTVF